LYELNSLHRRDALLPEASPEHDLAAAKHQRERNSMNQDISPRASKRQDVSHQNLRMLKCMGDGMGNRESFCV